MDRTTIIACSQINPGVPGWRSRGWHSRWPSHLVHDGFAQQVTAEAHALRVHVGAAQGGRELHVDGQEDPLVSEVRLSVELGHYGNVVLLNGCALLKLVQE